MDDAAWRRGDLVITVAPGDYGKPRPAVVVQSDLFNATHASLVVVPISSELTGLPLFRVEVDPSRENGLVKRSEMMVDKLSAIASRRVRRRIGRLNGDELRRLDAALRLWLDLPVTESNL